MKSVSKSPRGRKHFYLCAFTVIAASGAALGAACSSSDSGTSGSSVADSGADSSKGSSGTSGTSGADTGAIGAQEKDTCKGAAPGNSCQCSCAITGQKEDKTLHCLQPMQDTGECPTLCCTGEIDSGGSSSGTPITDAGGDG
jgi:hypothetical protein